MVDRGGLRGRRERRMVEGWRRIVVLARHITRAEEEEATA